MQRNCGSSNFFLPLPRLDKAVLRNHEEDWDEELSHPQKSSQKIKVSLVKVTLSHFSHAQLIQISTKQGDIPSAKKLQCTVLSTQGRRHTKGQRKNLWEILTHFLEKVEQRIKGKRKELGS